MGVYKRAGSQNLWVAYTAHGKRYFESTGTADRREAGKRERAIRASIGDGTWQPPGEQSQRRATVASYAALWTERRRGADVRTAGAEASRLRDYVLPQLGAVALEDLRRPALAAWLRALEGQVSVTTGKPLSPRSIRHVYSALRTMLLDAVADELLAVSPATLSVRKGELPKMRDADPRWRDGAIYSRTELEALVGDQSLPLDRRVYYGLLGLAGLRSSEAAGLRWRDYDARTEPLGRLLVATQITADRVQRETKTALPRRVPVHHVLEQLLRTWRREGWPQFFGRHPTDEDLVVPSRSGPLMARSSSRGRDRLLSDLERLGFRSEGRARHALRATFVSLATEDGAVPSILDLCVWAKHGGIRAGYQRFPWAALCAEVGKLRVELRSPVIVTLGPQAGRPRADRDSDRDSRPDPPGSVVKPNRGGGIRSQPQARNNAGSEGAAGDRASAKIPTIPIGRALPMQSVTQDRDSALREAADELRRAGREDLAQAVLVSLAGTVPRQA